ncbi:MAG: hypothetical protein Kow0069_11540 [Promethearchaeota archaeon]
MDWMAHSPLTKFESVTWFVGAGIGLGLFAYFLAKWRRAEFPQAKRFFFGLAAFAVTYSVARLIENFRKYFVSDDLQDIVNAWTAGEQITGLNWDLRIAYYVIAWFGIATFYFHAERHVFAGKTKYVLTLASVVEGTVSVLQYVFAPGSAAFRACSATAAVGFFVAGVFPVLLFVNMARTTTGTVRRNNLVVAVGLALFVTGVLADLPETGFITGQSLPQLITGPLAALLIFSGFVLMAAGFRSMYSSTIT